MEHFWSDNSEESGDDERSKAEILARKIEKIRIRRRKRIDYVFKSMVAKIDAGMLDIKNWDNENFEYIYEMNSEEIKIISDGEKLRKLFNEMLILGKKYGVIVTSPHKYEGHGDRLFIGRYCSFIFPKSE